MVLGYVLFSYQLIQLMVLPEELLDILSALVEKSLVVFQIPPEGPDRYRLLETAREFAREELDEGGEAKRTRDRHLEHFLTLAESAGAGLEGPEQETWLSCLELEHENLLAALEWWATLERDDARLRLAAALWRFWLIHGDFELGRAALNGALAAARDEATPSRARALQGAAALAQVQGDDLPSTQD